jgi:hypothetical protein
MNTDDTTRSGTTTARGRAERPGMFAHLSLGPDPRSPEEQLEAERKEGARRTGRRSKDWWLKSTQA